MFEFEACEILKTKEFTIVNDCFQNEHNVISGLYRQTLYSLNLVVVPVFLVLSNGVNVKC